MKDVLVLALGNVLAGDDAVAHEVLRGLEADTEVRALADLVAAGTDLFRQAEHMAGRSRLVIVDAALGDGPTPSVQVLRHPLPGAARRAHAHALDPVGALDLLRSIEPAIAALETWWLLVDVPEVTTGAGLSAAVRPLVPAATARLRELVLEGK